LFLDHLSQAKPHLGLVAFGERQGRPRFAAFPGGRSLDDLPDNDDHAPSREAQEYNHDPQVRKDGLELLVRHADLPLVLLHGKVAFEAS
jgi:hypothetical protein